MALLKGSNRYNVITATNNGDILPLGPAGTTSFVGTMGVQFAPSLDFVGSFQVLGKIMGTAADNAPYVPIPYRRVTVVAGGSVVASDYAMVSDPVVPTAMIHVPSAGLSIALLITCSAGTCQVFSMDLQGNSAV